MATNSVAMAPGGRSPSCSAPARYSGRAGSTLGATRT